jgi:hypothetical protein
MNTSNNPSSTLIAKGLLPSALIALMLIVSASLSTAAVLPSDSKPYGKSYSQWSAAFWQWALGLPTENHPFNDTPDFDVTEGQSGHVWFLASAFGTVERTATIPGGTALFVSMLDVEASSLEEPPFYGATEAEQREIATSFADLIVNVSCSIDDNAVSNIGQFRVASPQYQFTAPTPWIFGATGGTGTSVADGYYVMVAPLSAGQHTIHFSGAFKFSDAPGDEAPVDMTYHITVQ